MPVQNLSFYVSNRKTKMKLTNNKLVVVVVVVVVVAVAVAAETTVCYLVPRMKGKVSAKKLRSTSYIK